MRDLDIRGAGNLLGAEQSGFITDLGYDAYHKILDEAIQELKEDEFSDLFAKELEQQAKEISRDCLIETDLEVLIPDTYVSSVSERLQLYARLDNVKDERQLEEFLSGLTDRFGPLPPSVKELVGTVRLRQAGKEMGFQKISLRNGKLKGQFVTDDEYFRSGVFGHILEFANRHPRRVRLRDVSGQPGIQIENVADVGGAMECLGLMSAPKNL